MEPARIKVRDAGPGDTNFIISTWLRSYKHSSYFAKRIRNSVFFLFHHEAVTRILSRGDTRVLIACDVVDPAVIYGYMVFGEHGKDFLLHYIYVKSAFRDMGVARALLSAAPLPSDKFVFSHWTFAVDGLCEKFPQGVYVPYLL